MTLYLDTEFTTFKGSLISLALVSTDGSEFYGVVSPPPEEVIHPWVKEHVMPILGQEPEPYDKFCTRLACYLRTRQDQRIIADWPEDLAHLLNCLCKPEGVSYKLQLDLALIESGPLTSRIPHNALFDARALMEWHQEEIKAAMARDYQPYA